MKISTKGRYALKAVLYLAEQNRPVNIRTAAEGAGVTEKYLEQLFFLLRKEGVLDTVRGPKGGYFIVGDIRELTAGDIVRAAEGDLTPVPCVKDPNNCVSQQQDSCLTRALWIKIYDAVFSVLDTTTLAQLLESLSQLKNDSLKKLEYYI